MLANIESDTVRQDPAALFSLFNGISRLAIADQHSAIKLPCTLFVGSHDPVVQPQQSLVLISQLPKAKTVIFKNVGHMPFMEDTEAFFDALEQAITDYLAQYHRQHRLQQEEKVYDLSAV
jgi:pimeloyl-ACP methyl ester carboxylesterase